MLTLVTFWLVNNSRAPEDGAMCGVSKRSGNKRTLPGWETAPLLSRKAGRVVDAMATCTEHHEGGTGRMHLSGAGLPRGSLHRRVHASTYASRTAGRKHARPELNALPSALIRNRGSARCWRAEAHVDRGRPAPRLLARLSAGAASARAPFATPSPPMGVRGRGL